MIRLVFSHEWTRLIRSPKLIALMLLATLMLVSTTWWSASTDEVQVSLQAASAKQARADWLGQGDANPHGMAHYGDFVFRPNGPLARLDSGVQATMGQVLRIEGHKRNMPLSSAVSKAGPLARFGRFDPAFLLQKVVPLILILVGAGLSIGNRSGRHQWMLAHGASGRSLVIGQAAFLASIALGAVLLVAVTTLIASDVPLNDSDVPRFFGLISTYAISLVMFSCAVIIASSWSSNSTSAIMALIGIWLAGTILLPRMTATLASEIAPLPSRDAFETQMRDARSAEIDAHNPLDKRLAEMEAELMKKYGVATKEALPINFDGIAMQVDEEVGNLIWDEHYSRLEDRLKQQGQIAQFVSLINPFQALRSVSMTLAGTDLAHDLAFQDAAESYRRILVKKLNDEHAYGGSTTGDWSFTTDASFYANLEPFDYPVTPLNEALNSRLFELFSLLLWSVAIVFMLSKAGQRLERGIEA